MNNDDTSGTIEMHPNFSQLWDLVRNLDSGKSPEDCAMRLDIELQHTPNPESGWEPVEEK